LSSRKGASSYHPARTTHRAALLGARDAIDAELILTRLPPSLAAGWVQGQGTHRV